MSVFWMNVIQAEPRLHPTVVRIGSSNLITPKLIEKVRTIDGWMNTTNLLKIAVDIGNMSNLLIFTLGFVFCLYKLKKMI